MKRTKNENVYWVVPGGSIEKGELPEDAAIREAFEETSLVVTKLREAFKNTNEGRTEHYFEIISYEGTVGLGEGPEQIRQHSLNRYEPKWVPISFLDEINLQPSSIVEKLIELW
ncbi:NUDIX domain-containing protein [Reinekea forsetii]|nr:NUDIX domain-containing protein [Reinekea forsetii]